MVKQKFENDVLTIAVSGRIDTVNADVFEAEIKAARDEHPFGSIVIDADGLDYISSSGLRVIMKLRRHEADMCIVNTSPEVYDIFEVTGFTDMISIRKKLREISVSGCSIIAEGESGTIYRLSDDAIVKLFNTGISYEDVELERSLAQKALACGVPTAIAYDIISCKGRFGLVFEMINACTLGKAMEIFPNKIDDYVDKYVKLVKELKEAADFRGELPDFKDEYYKSIDNLSPYITEEENNILKDIVDALPDDNCVIHGDLNPCNIMLHGKELLIIDMAEVTRGCTLMDIFAIYRNLVMMADWPDEEFEKINGISKETALYVWKGFVSKLYEDESAAGLGLNKQFIRLGGIFSGIIALGRRVDKDSDKIPEVVDKALRGVLLPSANELIDMLENYSE